jgi:hypothetical protein
MDDVDVFRRFFVIREALSEILGGLFAGNDMTTDPDDISGNRRTNMNIKRHFGENPFIETGSDFADNEPLEDSSSFNFPG